MTLIWPLQRRTRLETQQSETLQKGSPGQGEWSNGDLIAVDDMGEDLNR